MTITRQDRDLGTAYAMQPSTSRTELTAVGRGTPMGELVRRYWHPVGLVSDATDIPRKVRILGEDLILFRDRLGRAGLLHARCCHRGTTLDYGIVQKASFSTNTTVTVQVAEGCTIPTSGGVSAMSYSGNKVPFGFPSQKDKWSIESLILSPVSTSGTTINTAYNPGGFNLNVPLGDWFLRAEIQWEVTSSAQTTDVSTGVSTSASSFTLPRLSARTIINQTSNSNVQYGTHHKSDYISTTTATPYYGIYYSVAAFSTGQFSGTLSAPYQCTVIVAENAYL